MRAFFLSAAAAASAVASSGNTRSASNADTLTGKLVAGYQGWHSTPNDGMNVNWFHWNNGGGIPSPTSVNFDIWPDMTHVPASELQATGFKYADGTAAGLFSDANPNTTLRYFKWMMDYGVHGVFQQRFVSDIAGGGDMLRFRDQIVKNMIAAAPSTGRAWCIEYDTTGSKDATVLSVLTKDWLHLVNDLHILDSPLYQHHRGHPVVILWGFGFDGAQYPATPATVAAVQAFFTAQNVTLVGGVPTDWRNNTRGFDAVFRAFPVLHPWLVGRFGDDKGADDELVNIILPDLVETNRLGIDYIPCVFPGFSWNNMHKQNPANPLNQIPRRGGDFYWHQVDNVLRKGGVKTIFTAMLDEYDEGTAIMPMTAMKSSTPQPHNWVAGDSDGLRVRSDWYLWMAGRVGKVLEGTESWPGPTAPTLPTNVTEAAADRLYRGILARAPDTSGGIMTASVLATGGTPALATNLISTADGFLASPEFAKEGLTPTQLANQIYGGVLGRAPTPAELSAALAAIQAKQTAQLVGGIVLCNVTQRVC